MDPVSNRSTMSGLRELTAELAGRLAATQSEQVDAEIETGMARLLSLLRADRVCWYLKPVDAMNLMRVYEVNAPGVAPSPLVLFPNELPYSISRLMRGDTLAIANLEELPAEAEPDRAFLSAFSVRSLVLIPSLSAKGDRGVLKVTAPAERRWPPALISELEVFGSVVVSTFDRKRAQESQRESDRQFRALVEQAPVGIALEDPDGRLLVVNSALSTMLGYTSDELVGMRCAEFGHPGDSEDESVLFQKLQAGLIPSYKLEKRYTTKDGTEIWGQLNVSRLTARPGQPTHVIAIVEDVTERKAVHEELTKAQAESRQLTARLIRARDDERDRIGRDLHDDVAQEVALLSLELQTLRRSLTASGQSADSELASTLCDRVGELAADVHDLSHALSSSTVQQLGLCGALKELCHRLSRQFEIEFDLRCEVTRVVPDELALCLFRVAQEALNNVTKHSGASRVFLNAIQTGERLTLTVRDTGVGFDSAHDVSGIGLASMRERLRIVGGKLFVQSHPGGGTEVVAEVSVLDDFLIT
jgi:PAS domain S-box-containing protein